ncbi:unnamed protein product [Ilex paraguariensis]|uniref:Uncharacterized protein n=1 Tax=Ilex paraguariensis TaxID=185542 RepID=A0ABC8RDD8_9AQUA
MIRYSSSTHMRGVSLVVEREVDGMYDCLESASLSSTGTFRKIWSISLEFSPISTRFSFNISNCSFKFISNPERVIQHRTKISSNYFPFVKRCLDSRNQFRCE